MSKQSKLVVLLVVIGIAVLGASGLALFKKSYTSPERVFNRMLENSLSTGSVTKSSVIASEEQNVKQTTHLQTIPEARVHGLVEINQTGQGGSYVKRESLVTPDTNFVRLVDVKTSQVGPSGKPFDFSSILGTWAQNPVDETANSLSQLYGQNVAVPYARLAAADRRALLNQIAQDGVYNVDYSKVQKITRNGRTAYVYEVSIKPVGFIKMMKTVGQLVGVRDYAEVDPETYKEFPDVKFVMTVDALSGDLVEANYGDDQLETYSGIGLRHIEQNPRDAVSTSELQQRLQRLQQ